MRRAIPIGHITTAIILASVTMAGHASATPLPPADSGSGLYKAHYHSMYRPYEPIARGKRVNIINRRFLPAQVVIFPGQTVIWRNNDDEPHTVTARNGRWDSGELPPGARFRLTFRRPGVYYYYCRIHPYMHGRIVVRG